jgi:hypothetical protein
MTVLLLTLGEIDHVVGAVVKTGLPVVPSRYPVVATAALERRGG